ncbi:hypothetical protein ACWCQZ_50425 [Streptomyces sp. NPDC002285]
MLLALLWECVALFKAGDADGETHLRALQRLLAHHPHRAVTFVANAMDVMLAIRSGELDRAERAARVCAELGVAAGDANSAVWHAAHLVAIRFYQDRLAELYPFLAQLVRSTEVSVVDDSFRAALALAAWPKAMSTLAALRGRGLAAMPRSSTWLVAMNWIVHAARLIGDADAAQEAYGLLQHFAELPMVVSLGVACFGSAHHALGVAALTIGDLNRAADHLRVGVQGNEALGHVPAADLSDRLLTQAPALRAESRRAGVMQMAPRATWATCTRIGHKWQFDFGRRSVIMDHNLGASYLAVLVANPGREINAAGRAVPGTLTAGAALSAQPLLDSVAQRDYRKRIAHLNREIEHFEAQGEKQRALLASSEHDWLAQELTGATGLGMRSRHFPTGDERARISVGKAIRRALKRLAAIDDDVAEHLRETVRMGSLCSYQPHRS